jgi:cytoskeletal protein RodZ
MAAGRTPGGFGSTLREARERRGITLRQIANATKISVSALEALERNDISRLPGGIFSRAFVRSYALHVGLEPEEAIRDFIAQFPHDSVTAGHAGSAQTDDHEAVESERRMASTVLRLLVISLPLAGVVIYYSAQGARRAQVADTPPVSAAPGNPAAVPPAVATASSQLAESPRPVPEPAVPSAELPAAIPPVETIAQAATGRLVIGLSATSPCWVSAFVDGQQAIRRELASGEQHTFEINREFAISVGDAGGLSVTLNGAPARPLGKPGQVLESVRINLTNFKDFLATP